MKIYDLTLRLSVHGSVFPGTPEMDYNLSHTIEKDHYNLGIASINSHAGTHTDAPRHFLEEGSCLDAVPLEKYIGYTVVADCTQKQAFDKIDVSDLLPYEDRIRKYKKLLLHTNWSNYAGEPEFYTDYPIITEELADWLVSLGLELIGVEAPSLNPEKYIEVHKTFLSNGTAIIESLTNLSSLPSDIVFFSAAPIPLAEADGFPVRALAIEF
ncbi:MAG: cyclase family protein [Eubacteriales bacterium]